MNDLHKARQINEFRVENNLALLSMVETKVKEEKFSRISVIICPRWSYIHNYQSDPSGRIWLAWDPGYFQITKINETDQLIHNKVTNLVTNQIFFLTVIYARNNFDRRQELWRDLIQMKGQTIGPWCLMGDYNNILYSEERVGCEPTHPKEIEYFMDCINKIEVFDMQAIGFRYSWTNFGEGQHRKCSRIDRTMINVEWSTTFPNTTTTFTPP